MKKKSVRTAHKPSAAPPAAQVNAVRKLALEGRHQLARKRLDELLGHYPDFKPLLALGWEVEDSAGDFNAACLYAWDWSSARPGSLDALTALHDSAVRAGLPMLAESVMQRLASAQGLDFPGMTLPPEMLKDLTFEQLVALELSLLFLRNNRFEAALAALEGCDHPSARNNRALARFALGDIAAALAEADANWSRGEHNFFALHMLVRLRLWTGGYEPACELAGALRGTEPLRPEDAYGKMYGLLLLNEHQEMIRAWKAMRHADFWDKRYMYEKSTCAYFAGLAALRLGEMYRANRFFSEAYEIDPGNPNAEMAAIDIDGLGQEPDLKAGEFHDWFPQSWIAKVQSAKSEAAGDAVLQAQCRQCDAHEDYLVIAAELGGQSVRLYALKTLKLRALNGSAAARDALLDLLCRPCGPDGVRTKLAAWLQENGFVKAGQSMSVLANGEVRELIAFPVKLHAEQRYKVPPAMQDRYEDMYDLLMDHQFRPALRIAEALSAEYPENPMLLVNMAKAREMLGDRLEDIELLYRRAADLDPDYLFAQTGLSCIAARKGQVEQARKLLEPLKGREEYHYSEWRAILVAQREIAIAERDRERRQTIDMALKTLADQFG